MEILTEHPESLDETCEEVDLDLQGFLSTRSCREVAELAA